MRYQLVYNESLWYFHYECFFSIAYILTNLLYHTESIIDSIQDSKLSLRKFQDSRTCTRLLTTLLKLFVTSCTSQADLQMHINTLKHLKTPQTSWKGWTPSPKTQELPTLSCHQLGRLLFIVNWNKQSNTLGHLNRVSCCNKITPYMRF